MRRLAVFSFFSDGGQITVNGSGWCSPPTPPSGLSITSSPLAPLTILPPHRHRASAAITYRITSRQKVNFPTGHLSKPITAGGQDEVKWHDLWDGWKGRGHKCIANLRDVQIKAQEVRDPKGWCGTEVPLNAP